MSGSCFVLLAACALFLQGAEPRISAKYFGNVIKGRRMLQDQVSAESAAALAAGAAAFGVWLSGKTARQLEELKHEVPCTQHRGIVIPAGGKDLQVNAYVSIKVLRERLNCRLPVDVFHWAEEDQEMKRVLEALDGVQLVDGSTIQMPAHHKQLQSNNGIPTGYLIKVYALYASRFDQVIMLDSDSMPLQNPGRLFSDPQFVAGGSLFWPDYSFGGRDEDLYTLLGLSSPKINVQTESGQLVLDRRRHVDVLEWLWFLMTEHETVFQYSFGDKDTYHAAFALAGKEADFQQVSSPPRSAVLLKDGALRVYVQAAMVQSDNKAVPLFMHRTTYGAKFGLDRAPLVPTHLTPPMTPEYLKMLRYNETTHMFDFKPASMPRARRELGEGAAGEAGSAVIPLRSFGKRTAALMALAPSHFVGALQHQFAVSRSHR